MSLIKASLLSANAYLAFKASTPPNPPPPIDEFVKDSEKKIPWLYLFNAGVVKMMYTTICMAECVVILASNYPAHPTSHFALSKLVTSSAYHDAPARLQLTPPFIVGIILCMSGSLLRLLCFRELGTLFTFRFCIRKDHKLVTTGPYEYVRHPSYSGMVMSFVGGLMCHLTRGSWLMECSKPGDTYITIFVWTWIFLAAWGCVNGIVRAPEEDARLREEFGTQWDRWAEKVQYRIIPGVF